jgi:hypothetical protein
MLWVILELLIVEEQLLASRKNKLGATIVALQNSVDKFHGRLPWGRENQ